MHENDTRHLPHLDFELAWARARPRRHQTPIPPVGADVFYRHNKWGPVVQAEVLEVQSLDDIEDPNLWTIQLGPDGHPAEFDGKTILAPSADPWPLLILRTAHLGYPQTREARLRGSEGWLPLDWETRYRPRPEYVLARAGS